MSFMQAMELYVENQRQLSTPTTKISISVLTHATSLESRKCKQKQLLHKILEVLLVEKDHSDSLPEERFGQIEVLLELYFDLGREVSNSGACKLSDENEDLIQKTAYGIADISFTIEAFLRQFRSRYLKFGEEGSAEYVCILRSGLEYMFGLYDMLLELVYEDGNCTYGEIIRTIQQEGSFARLNEDFHHWWQTERYLDESARKMSPKEHWWWD